MNNAKADTHTAATRPHPRRSRHQHRDAPRAPRARSPLTKPITDRARPPEHPTPLAPGCEDDLLLSPLPHVAWIVLAAAGVRALLHDRQVHAHLRHSWRPRLPRNPAALRRRRQRTSDDRDPAPARRRDDSPEQRRGSSGVGRAWKPSPARLGTRRSRRPTSSRRLISCGRSTSSGCRARLCGSAADDPGAGKTIMAGLYVKELILREDVKRCLVVVPGGRVNQWKGRAVLEFGLAFEPNW